MSSPPATDPPLDRVFWQAVQPAPGKLHLSAMVALICMAVVILAMALQVPEAAVSCYLVFFAAKEDAGSGIAMGLALIVGAAVGIAIGFLFVMASAAEPMVRLALLVVFTFTGMFFSQASKLGPVAATVGFALAFVMTLFDDVPIPELLTRGLLWMWVVVALPMACLIVANMVAGRDPGRMLKDEVAERLAAVAAVLRAPSDEALADLEARLAPGNAEALKLGKMASLVRALTPAARARLETLLALSFQLGAVTAAMAREGGTVALAPLAGYLDRAAETVRTGNTLAEPLPDLALPSDEPTAGLVEAQALSQRMAALLAGEQAEAGAVAVAAEPFLAPDAFTNPEYLRFALKTTLAVAVCYIVYTSLGWFGIHTALVTCFYVALSSAGETIHKLTLRLLGCLIGAALGIGAIVFLMPHMEDVGQLALLVGAVSFGAAWISFSGPRVSYMGWQIALAFFLCVLHGFGPSFDLVVARDRVLGILLGNVVMTLVFATVWPVSAAGAMRRATARAAEALAALARPLAAPAADLFRNLDTAEASFAAAGRAREFLRYEPATLRPDAPALSALDRNLEDLRRLAGPVLVTALYPRDDDLADHLPLSVQETVDAFHKAVADWFSSCANPAMDSLPAWQGSAAGVDAALKGVRGLPDHLKRQVEERRALYGLLDEALARTAGSRADAR